MEFLVHDEMELLVDTGKFFLYKFKKSTPQSLFIKEFKNLNNGQQAFSSHEYDISRLFQNNYIVQYHEKRLFQNHDALSFSLPDPEANILKNFMPKGGFEVDFFLKIALQLLDALSEIHEKGVIHNDIFLDNLIYSPKADSVYLGGFHYSFLANKQPSPNLAIENWLDHLSYISPEQTGRISRSVDHRSDLYALGSLFYKMLTGRPLFITENPLEIIHFHLAKEPISLLQIKPTIPPMINEIIMLLVRKNPEQRYQSPLALKNDLEFCQKSYEKTMAIPNFSPKKNFYMQGIHIPNKIYGRNKEIQAILQFINQDTEAVKFILVSGESGMGKTALIDYFDNIDLIGSRVFVKGKYSKNNQNIAYSAIIQAFRMVVKRIISSNESSILSWKEKIISELSKNIKIIIDLIPELEIIIGSPVNPIILNQSEAENRFLFTLKKFITIFCTREEPLVLFLDDLQWADNASIDFLYQLAIDSEITNLIIIASYRENELDNIHKLHRNLQKIKKKGVILKEIHLDPLPNETVKQLIFDTIYPLAGNVDELLFVIHQKTYGNPLFVRQFLRMLYDEGLLYFNKSFEWNWNDEKISNIPVLENVIHLLERRIKSLPVKIKSLLARASCLGNHFAFNAVSHLMESEDDAILSRLDEAVKAGLLTLTNDNYSFIHDRIHDIFYNIIPDQEKIIIHKKIGDYIIAKGNYQIYDLVFHKNKSIPLYQSQSEKINLSKLNLTAAQLAKTSNAYSTALHYVDVALSLIEDLDSNLLIQHKFMLSMEAGEILCLNNLADRSDEYFNQAINYAESDYDKIKVYEKLIIKNASQNKFAEAMEFSRTALRLLNFMVPNLIDQEIIDKERIAVEKLLSHYTILNLIELPEVKEPNDLLIAKILTMTIPSSYHHSNSNDFKFLAYSLIRHCIEKGNSPYSAYGYIMYAGLLASNQTTLKQGYEYGKLAIALVEKFNVLSIQAKVFHLFGALISHWQEHLRDSQKYLLTAYKQGLDTGDFTYVSYSVVNFIFNLFFMGERIETIHSIQHHYFQKLKTLRHFGSIQIFRLWFQFITNLRTKDKSDFDLSGEIINEKVLLNEWKEANHSSNLARYYITKQLMCYFLGNFERSLAFSEKAERYLDSIRGMFFIPIHFFYKALALLSSFPKDSETPDIIKDIENLVDYFYVLSDQSPANFQNKYFLLKALQCQLKGDFEGTIEFFDQSINFAKKNGFIHEEALANELYARFWLEKQKENLSTQFLNSAFHLYKSWGAEFKVRDIERKYQILYQSTIYPPKVQNFQNEKSSLLLFSTLPSLSELEYKNIIQSAISISSEIDLKKLLTKMIRLVIEVAGAEKGYLILQRHGKLMIEAEASLETQIINVLQSIPMETHEHLAKTIIQYVDRTGDKIILHNAAQDSEFKYDNYIKKYQPKSIFCISLRHQENSIGILYLENNLAPNAFTEKKIDLLQILLSQSAIALENASLFSEMARLNENLQSEIVEKKLSQEALYESELRFKRMADNIRDGLMIMENDKIVYVNERLVSIYGYSESEIRKMSLLDIVSTEDKEKAKDFLEKIQKNLPLPDKLEIWIIRKDGSKRCIQNRYSSKFKGEGITERYIITTDTTKRITVEREMQRLNEELEKRVKERTAMLEITNKELEAFSYSVSHDLRAPLRTIDGFSRILESEYFERIDDTGKNYLLRIRNSCKKMDQLIVDLLTLSRITRKEIFLEKVNLSQIVGTIVQNYKELSPDKNYHIVIQDGIVSIGDANLIRIALDNLIGNAWKYTKKNPSPKIEFGEIFEENEKYFFVKDNGVGFEKNVANRLFKVFQRFHKEEEFEGTGVGLATVQRIIERHGGRVWADGKVNEGATFYFTLPFNY